MTQAMVRRNQFGELVEGDQEEVMTLDKWQDRWTAGQTRFHGPHTHRMLEKHIEVLTGGKRHLNFFLPMCGKSVDLKWLADQGHNVIGNEFVELACQQFFQENSIEYNVSEISGISGKLFKSKDPNISISLYCCDFFQLSSDVIRDEINCIWDRGSFAASSRTRLKDYARVMKNLMKPHTRYMLDCFRVDNNVFAGPPYDTPPEILTELYGDQYSIEKIDERDAMSEWQKSWGVSYFIENVFLMTPK